MQVKAAFDILGYAAGAALLLVALGLQWRKHLRPARELVWFLAFGAVLLAMSLAMPGSDHRLLGFIALLAAWLLGQARWPARAKQGLSWILRALALVVIADTLWHLGRPDWINPNTYGALLVLGLPFVGSKHWAGVWVIALICTGSRGTMLAVLLPLLWWNRDFVKRHLRAAIALAVVGVLFILVRPATIMARFDHWAEALRLFAASPSVGWGPGSYIDVSRIPFQNHADNAFLTLLSEQGLIGVWALAPLAVVVVLRWRIGDPLVRLALAATLLHNLVDDTWLSPWPALLLGLNLALLWRTDEVVVDETLAVADGALGGPAAPAPAPGPAVE